MGKDSRMRLFVVITRRQGRWLRQDAARRRAVAREVGALIDAGIEKTRWVDPGPSADDDENYYSTADAEEVL